MLDLEELLGREGQMRRGREPRWTGPSQELELPLFTDCAELVQSPLSPGASTVTHVISMSPQHTEVGTLLHTHIFPSLLSRLKEKDF